jgi:predicted nucleic acid-binding protein
VVTGSGDTTFESWPSPPPVSTNPAADAVGVVNDAREFSLCLSGHIVAGAAHVLAEAYHWQDSRIGSYLEQLIKIATKSGGQILDPPLSVADSRDWEDNRILELAEAAGAFLIVSDDRDLAGMSPWRGIPVIGARAFASRVDAMRRAARSRG